MYHNFCWPGAYSFKNEIGLFVQALKEFFEDLLNKIEDVEKLTA